MSLRIAFLAALLTLLTIASADEHNRLESSTSRTYEVAITNDLQYLSPDREQTCDLYQPANASPGETFPGIVIIHGGGWTKGDKAARREQEIGNTLAANGYVCISINYLLHTDKPNPWPQNLHDCKNAVRFLRRYAEKYHVDPDHIGAIGGSAGGHLTSMLAVTGPEKRFEPNEPYPGYSSQIQAAVDLYGISDLATWQETDPNGRPTGIRKLGPGERLLGVSLDENPQRWQAASPVYNITPDDPPILILHGLADTTVDYEQSIVFARRLSHRGVENILHLIPNVGHTFAFRTDSRGRPLPEDLTPLVLDFFNKHLKHPTDSQRQPSQ
ncbi:MAG: alpha/beta hydrolase [Sedimentisphaerales bacterium]|nr:alpha/beta hydrolase [Sedimentisphaerales bacterium]